MDNRINIYTKFFLESYPIGIGDDMMDTKIISKSDIEVAIKNNNIKPVSCENITYSNNNKFSKVSKKAKEILGKK